MQEFVRGTEFHDDYKDETQLRVINDGKLPSTTTLSS